VSWSLLTVHITSAIALQLMHGLYNGQQRHLTLKRTPKIIFQKCLDFVFQKTFTMCSGLHNPDKGYFWYFDRAREKQEWWEK